MKNISWISCILFIKILSDTCTAAHLKDECPFSDDFKRYTENTSNETIQFCAKLVLKKETWEFSNAFCRLHFSSLTYKIGLNSTLHREWIDKEFRTDELLWVGIRRIANFFVVNSTGKLYREKMNISSPNFWGDRWFREENRNHDCVALNVTSGDLVTRDCNSRFYYICDDRGVPHPEKLEEPFCPVSHPTFSYYLIGMDMKCISTFPPRPGKVAVTTCEKYKSRLATSDEYNILFSGNSSQFNNITAYWVNTDNYGSCVFKTFQVINGRTNEGSENCSKSLPFTCVKELENTDVEVLISPSNFRPFPSTSTCEVLFKCDVKIDGKVFGKRKDLLYQWYKDDIPIAQNGYGFMMSYFAEPIKKDSSDDVDIANRQGSYHCEVRIIGSWRSFSSQKMDFFYSDIATYIIDINGLVPYDFRDYSEQDFTDYMTHFDGYVNTEKMKKISARVNTKWDFQSISVHDGIATSKIVLYVSRSDNELDEEKTYQEIKSAFNYTTFDITSPTSRTISFSVSSADVCFRKELENDACDGKIRWPTSIQTVSVNTESICIDKSKRLVPRKCKASMTTKAKWSEFNCSSCESIQQRVKGVNIPCFEGYRKFTNTNLCFKIHYEKETWHDAHRICSENSSYMLNEFYDISKSFLTSLERFWLSYTYSHGKIQGIGMKPKYSKIKYSGSNSNPDFHCLAAVASHDDYTSVLEKCNRKLPFVCVQDPFEVISSVKFSNTWNKLSTQKNCYFFAKKDAYDWQEAAKKCQQMEPKADFAIGILKREPYGYFKRLIHQLFLKPECKSTSWWINLTYDEKTVDFLKPNAEYLDWDPYTNFNLNESNGAITLFPKDKIYWTLQKPTTKYKYVCEIQDCKDARPTQAYIEDRSKENENFSLKCIPSGWFLTRSISWYKDGILLNISTDQLSFTYNSDLSSSLQDLSKYQGYYWCSVDQLQPRQTTFSSKILFKYPGIHTYVLSMKSHSYLDTCVKSMLSEISHLDHEALNHIAECFNKRLHALKVFHLAVRNLTCNSSHVDITVHIYSNNTDEEGILKHIQGANFNQLAKECLVDLESISARSTVACYGVKTELKHETLTWSKTNIGENAIPKELCLEDDGRLVKRKCLGDFNTGAVWAPISITECSTHSKSEVTEQLYEILNSEVSFNSSKKLVSLTISPEILVPADIEILAEIFENFSRQPSLEHQILNHVVETISNLFGVSPNVQRGTRNSFNKIMKDFEGIASAVDVKNKSFQIATMNLAVTVQPINLTSSVIPNCVVLPEWSKNLTTLFSSKHLPDSIKNSVAGIVIPSLLETKSSNMPDRLIYDIRKNWNSVTNFTVVSAVIQASYPNFTEYDISPPVRMAFKLNEEFKYANRSSIKCVFWDEKLNNSLGSWSYKGCLLEEWNSDDVIECSCNHLTSFAIILDGDSNNLISEADKAALSYITYVGCSLSCFGLSAIILTFICFRQWRKSVKNKALFNLSVCLLVFMILYMTGMKKNSLSKLCFAISITLHYLLLACFAWMLVSAFLMYLNLVKVFNTYIPRLIQKAMLFAYGVPALIVIIIMSYRLELYTKDEYYCWLSKDAFYYGIAGPILTILLINFIFFGLILHANTCGKSKIYLHSNQDKRKQNITRAKAMFYTSVLLGLSWIFGFLAVGSVKVIFQYLFAITTTLQGFLFFLFFIVKQKSAYDMWSKVIFPTSITERSNVSHISGSAASYSNRIIQDSECNSDNGHRNLIFRT